MPLPPFTGECYVGATAIDRVQFAVGREVSFSHLFSATSLWRVAVEAVPEFTTKRREGVVFILKPQESARHIGAFSEFADGEVALLPFSRWRVAQWYHGDIICLGQPNIRAHTFRIKSENDTEKWDGVVVGKNRAHESLEEMAHPDCRRALIVELHELPRVRTALLE